MCRGHTRLVRLFKRTVLSFCVCVAVACKQNMDLPKPGTADAEVRRGLGEPSRTVAQSRELIEQYVKGLDGCSDERVARTAKVWVYEKDSHQAVVVGIDQSGKVLCAGHRGITFVH
jgi:hypothetical protein